VTGITVDMSRIDAMLKLQCRLSAIPDSATVRGVFFNQLRDALKRELAIDDASLGALVGAPKSSHKMYSARDLAKAYAVTGALVDADPLEGMRRLSRGMASYFSTTWFGRTFQRLLRPDPFGAIQWVAFSRDYISNFGHLRVERRGPTHALVHFYDEYCWIEACQRGGCEGMLTACGVEGTVTAELDTPFRGRLDVQWSAQP
jgi:uncharacterized protein (TIGR02265 family)